MDKARIEQKRHRYQLALAAALEQIVTELARRPEVVRAILFGSYARGRADLRTDLDILVVMDSTQDLLTRTAELYRELACPVDIDLLVYTPQELERRRQRGIVRQALEQGKVIYERGAASPPVTRTGCRMASRPTSIPARLPSRQRPWPGRLWLRWRSCWIGWPPDPPSGAGAAGLAGPGTSGMGSRREAAAGGGWRSAAAWRREKGRG